MKKITKRQEEALARHKKEHGHTKKHIDEMKKLKPAIMISQAYIFDKDKKHVWTFSSYDSEAAVFSDRNCFPRSIISKMEKIKL